MFLGSCSLMQGGVIEGRCDVLACGTAVYISFCRYCLTEWGSESKCHREPGLFPVLQQFWYELQGVQGRAIHA